MKLSILGSAVVFSSALAGAAHAINITPTSDPFALANTLFLNASGLTIQSATLSSAASVAGFGDQAGTYMNPQGTYGLPNVGIALSTGNVADYATGPNNETGTTTAFDSGITSATAEQIGLLSSVTGQTDIFDPVDLRIQFFADAATSNVTFFAVFGSEEFPEYTNGGVNDGFGLFVNGQNVAAVLPTGGVPGDPLTPINIDNPDFLTVGGTELDGILAPNGNGVLRFDVPVTSGSVNEFVILLADAGDEVVDTTVYLSSFFGDSSAGGGGGDGTGGSGASEFFPILPNNPPDPATGEFVIAIPDALPPGEVVWIDPPVTVGYEYAATGGLFDSIVAPSLATVADLDGYFVTVNGTTVALASGATLDFFSTFGLNPDAFTLTGIDTSLVIDPTDPLGFPLGVSFINTSFSTTVSVTPITVDTAQVPLPASLWLFGSALVALRLRARTKV